MIADTDGYTNARIGTKIAQSNTESKYGQPLLAGT